MKSLNTLRIMIIMTLIFFTGSSYARHDYKIFPGSQCHAAKGDEDLHLDRGTNGSLTNNDSRLSVDFISIICPITRDTSEPAHLDAGIWLDSASKGEITCRFFSVDSKGAEVTPSPPPGTASFDGNPGAKPVYFSVNKSQTAFDGTYAIQCNLPKLGFVYRYIIGEDAQTDDGF